MHVIQVYASNATNHATLRSLNDKILQSMNGMVNQVLPNLYRVVKSMQRIFNQHTQERFVRGGNVPPPDKITSAHVDAMHDRANRFMNVISDNFKNDQSTYESVSQRQASQHLNQLQSTQEKLSAAESELMQFERISKQVQERSDRADRLDQLILKMLVDLRICAIRDQLTDASESDSNIDQVPTDVVDKLNHLCDFMKNLMSQMAEKMKRNLSKPTSSSRSSSLSSVDLDQPTAISKTPSVSVTIKRASNHDTLFATQSDVNREQSLKQSYEKRLEYLIRQIEVCDEKSVEYRVQWQVAVAQLEQAMEKERQIQLQLQQTQHLLEHTQDDLKTVRSSYEKQIQVLSDSLTTIKEQDKVNVYGNMSNAQSSQQDQQQGGLFDFFSKR
ncbi:hypothetical protein AKO1_005574 [Acrasis kona]|uniref:Protein phosphatase 1 regulatory subunit 21 C-terminal domain-containing protein n=1 Tax=Acrasis kona TaxID=1008807 RepID=A0AAW2ZL06_9EUKA